MEWFDQNLLSTVVFLPLAWALIGLLIPTGSAGGRATLRNFTLLGSLVTFVVSIAIYNRFSGTGAEFQLAESAPWLPGLGINYSMGIDGISLWLVLLTTFLM